MVGACLEAWQGPAQAVREPEDDGKVPGFEPLANQRLLPPTFPRYTEIVTRDQTLAYLDQLLARLGVITTIIQVNTFHATLDFFHSFSARSPCVLSRSLLQLLYTPLNYSLTSRPTGVSPAAGPPLPPAP